MTNSNEMRPGTTALVTGASSGIGRAIAEGLLDRGTNVICVSRNTDPLEGVGDGRAGLAHLLAADVSDPDAMAGLPDRLPPELSEIDILIASAGSDVGGRRRFDEGAMEDWAQTIDTNVIGLMRCCHAVLPGMLERGRGHIVTLGSVAGLGTYAGGSVYSASKYAVRAFTESLRKDYLTDPIRITEILPGLIRTGFAQARHRGDQGKADAFYDAAPAALEPEDVAAAVFFALEQPAQVNIGQIVVTPTGNK